MGNFHKYLLIFQSFQLHYFATVIKVVIHQYKLQTTSMIIPQLAHLEQNIFFTSV